MIKIQEIKWWGWYYNLLLFGVRNFQGIVKGNRLNSKRLIHN